jgi:hypothetical protein
MARNKFPLAPVILAVCALGLGAYIYFYESRHASSDEAKSQHARLLPGLEAEMVQRLSFTVPASGAQPASGYEIARRPGESAASKKAEPFEGAAALRWDLFKPVQGRADRFAVENLINRLRDLDHLRAITPSTGELKQYGLDAPLATVTLTLDEKRARELKLPAQVRLELGGPTPFPEENYLRDGSGAIYVVSGGLLEGMNPPLMNLRDKRLFDFDSSEIDRIELAAAGKPAQSLLRGKERWSFTAPVADWAAPEQADTLLSSLQLLNATAFVEGAAAAPDASGLKAPVLKITVTPKKGPAQWLEIGGVAPDGATAPPASAGQPARKLRYARSSLSPAVVMLEESMLETFLAGDPVARDPAIVPLKQWVAAQFGAGPLFKLAQKPLIWSAAPMDQTQELDGGLLTARIEALQQLQNSGFGGAIAGREKELGLEPPARTLKLTGADKSALELRLGAETPQGRVLQIVGRPGVIYINQNAASFFSADGHEFFRAKSAAASAAKP